MASLYRPKSRPTLGKRKLSPQYANREIGSHLRLTTVTCLYLDYGLQRSPEAVGALTHDSSVDDIGTLDESAATKHCLPREAHLTSQCCRGKEKVEHHTQIRLPAIRSSIRGLYPLLLGLGVSHLFLAKLQTQHAFCHHIQRRERPKAVPTHDSRREL